MTYCFATAIDAGLVFVSDSRTHAGADRISTSSKMHRFSFAKSVRRFFVVLCSGNLATTQGVIARLRRDIKDHEHESLLTVADIDRAAEYIGYVSTEEQRKYHRSRTENDFLPEASFLLGGQIHGEHPSIARIYPEGNFIHCSDAMPFLQIGEVKYGKPILDRIVTRRTSLANALRCGHLFRWIQRCVATLPSGHQLSTWSTERINIKRLFALNSKRIITIGWH